jgi:CMP-N-acetylneuraminic acid synthetase|tara:strand:- start:24991 stop:25674 length:684 start_codon:yes stop_codon:yes gene_type:complete
MKIFTYIKNDSNRINKKNFQLIGDLELWKHLIYELNELGSEIYIDTDSSNVIEDCRVDPKLSNVTAYPRKEEYIKIENDPNNSLSPANLMLENFLDTYVTDEDETIVLTHVTSPFLKKETIENVIEKYETGQFEYIHSVNKEKDFGFLERFENPINFNPNVIQRTQDLKPIYFSNGAFFVMTKRIFKKNKNRWGPSVYFYPLDAIEGVEIDYPEDLKLAKIIYGGMR